MTTVQTIFDIAVRLMDEQHVSSGDTCTEDTRVYLLRTPSLLNSLLDRCAQLEGLPEDGPRTVPRVQAMEDPVDLDDRVCTGVLPYGLAGLLLSEEDPGRANFFWQTFLEQLRWGAFSLPGREQAVADHYGVALEHGQFGSW